MILRDLFKKHAREIPNDEALVFKERRITYKQYDEMTDRVAMGLLKLGVQHGERIGIYGPLWPEIVIAHFGATKIGAIGVPMSVRTTPPELKFFVNDSEISVLFMPSGFMGADFLANLEAVRKEMPTLKHVVCFDREADGILLWEKFLTEPDAATLQKAADAVQEDDSALFIYTSGTTGVPKAAQLTHKNLIVYTNAQIECMDYHRGHSIVLNLPFSHVGGAVMGITANLNAGNKVVMMDVFNPEETLRLVSEEKATTLGQVPAMYAMELAHPNLSKYDISSLKIPIVSSQPCPSELISAFKRIVGIIPLNAYGLTECTAAITFTHQEDGEEKLTYSVGKPISCIEMVLKDDDDNIVPQGQAGEICVKGPVVMKGSWKRPAEDAKVFDADGFLHTGDMGRFEEDGSVVIVGRKKEMYIRGGENVYPPEIEDVICRHPDVMLAAVIGRPHEKWGEVGRAYIMPKPGKNPSPEEIKEFLKDKLSNFKIPEDIIVRPMLPLTPLGKVKKLDLYKEMKQELGK